MKLFFPFIVFAISHQSFSQQPKIGIDTVHWFGKFPKDSLHWLALNPVPAFPQAKLSHVLPNGNKIYKLPVDNMPCLVPDESMYHYNMPVVKGKISGTIPNASPPVQIIPKKKE
jgi:hypothetical protein